MICATGRGAAAISMQVFNVVLHLLCLVAPWMTHDSVSTVNDHRP